MSNEPAAKRARTWVPTGEWPPRRGGDGASAPADALDSTRDALEFAVLDVLKDDSRSDVPGIHLFGVTAAGDSVALLVRGFRPYFYVRSVPGVFETPGVRRGARARGVGWRR